MTERGSVPAIDLDVLREEIRRRTGADVATGPLGRALAASVSEKLAESEEQENRRKARAEAAVRDEAKRRREESAPKRDPLDGFRFVFSSAVSLRGAPPLPRPPRHGDVNERGDLREGTS